MLEFQSLENETSALSLKSQEKLLKYQEEKLEELTDPHNFALGSERTKIANDYVKHLKQ